MGVQVESETGVTGGDMWINPAFASETASSGGGPETNHVEPPLAGGKLLQGDFDEETEHKQFRAAVDAWRTGKHGPKPATSVAGEDKGETQSCWYCYGIFPQDEGYFDKELGHWFKSQENCEKYKVDEAEKEAVKEKRRKQLDEIMKKHRSRRRHSPRHYTIPTLMTKMLSLVPR